MTGSSFPAAASLVRSRPYFLEGFVGGFRILRGNALAAANFLEHAHQAVARNAQILEGFLIRGREENMLDRNVFVLETLSLVFGSTQ